MLRDGGKQYIATLQQRERERTGIPSLKVGFNKVFGYYLEITNAHATKVPADYERRQTLAGAERYVTPELKEYEAKVLGAEERIAAREAELFAAVRGRVGGGDRPDPAHRRARWRGSTSGARWREVRGASTATCGRRWTTASALELRQCRHPVVERLMPREQFIPNDVRSPKRSACCW